MGADSNHDDVGHSYADMLSEMEVSLAAVIRQYRRAAEASDAAAVTHERESIGCLIRRMITIHLEAHIGMPSNEWVWLDADEECKVELPGTDIEVSGRIWCSLPEGHREWTEPFAARIAVSKDGSRLADYTFRFGTRATVLDLATVERIVRGGELPTPTLRIARFLRGDPVFSPAAPSDDGWAYVFRMGETTEVESTGE